MQSFRPINLTIIALIERTLQRLIAGASGCRVGSTNQSIVERIDGEQENRDVYEQKYVIPVSNTF